MSAPVLTVTLNPALDITTTTARLEPQRKLRCERAVETPGGGGANVSRMIHALGGASDAFVALDGPTGARWRRLAEAEGLSLIIEGAPGDTRESFQVAIDESGDFYRFILPGPHWDDVAGAQLARKLEAQIDSGAYRWLVLSGSLPPGMEARLPARIARKAAEIGIAVIADCAGPPLRHLLDAPLAILRLNRHDLAEAGVALGMADAAPDDIARSIVGTGRVEAVLYSLGAAGTVLVQPRGSVHFVPPAVEVVSLTGAGDSLTGTLVHALAYGSGIEDAARRAVAAAAATALQPGSRLADPADIERLLPDIREDHRSPR